MCHFPYLILRERPQRDGTEQSDLDALLACYLDGFLRQSCCGAKGYDDVVGVVALQRLISYFVFFYLTVFLLQVDVVLFHCLGLQFERGVDVGLAVFGASDGCPRTLASDLFLGATWLVWWQHHLFHHLSDDAVAEYHCWVAVFEGEVEGEIDKVCHLLYGVGCQHDDVIVAIAAAFGGLDIVALRWLNGA